VKNAFTEALESRDLRLLRKVPKSDLHNHSLMGGRLSSMEKFSGRELEKFSNGTKGVHGINEWLGKVYRPLFDLPGAFKAAVDAAFIQAKSDGVTVLEMSMDAYMGRLFNIRPEVVVSTFTASHQAIAPEIDFRPELGFSRILPVRTLLSCFEPYIGMNFFRSIDLYDVEDAQPLENFRELYRFSKKMGMKCKAHAGEFGDAGSVRKSVEILEHWCCFITGSYGLALKKQDQVKCLPGKQYLPEKGKILQNTSLAHSFRSRCESYREYR
jgi:adenosine deaminase